jgi:tRNA G10  N-methylase Trm11
LTNYPKFIEIASLSEAKSANVDNNYVRVQATLLSTETKEEIKKVLQKRGAKGFIFYLIDEAKIFDDEDKNEVVNKAIFDRKEVISSFVEKTKTGLNKKKLIRYGEEIMEKANG